MHSPLAKLLICHVLFTLNYHLLVKLLSLLLRFTFSSVLVSHFDLIFHLSRFFLSLPIALLHTIFLILFGLLHALVDSSAA